MISKEDIFQLIKQYYIENKKSLSNDNVPVSGKVFDENEIINIVDAAIDGWWTEGKYSEIFEQKLSKFLGISNCISVNSGSSANLIALTALTSPLIPKERRVKEKDEIITTAASFPTTINPIIQNNAIPVLLDIDIPTYNISVDNIESAITERTKGIFVAHTMGNPFNIEKIMEIAKDYNLWVIEDNCDALGSKYKGQKTGSFGHISTQSYYPAHHITTAEGGSIGTNDSILKRIIISIRDWGRDCWCRTGADNTCKSRYKWKLGNLPDGYDHKYTYSHIGYNLKMTDLQAAIGVAQLDKLENFNSIRRDNYNYLMKRFIEESLNDVFILPQSTKNSDPCWFGFLLTIKKHQINREHFLQYLNSKNIATRLLFGGNITKQPYFLNYNIKYRIIGELKNTDEVMNKTFWIGLYPALKQEHFEYVITIIKNYLKQNL